MTAFRPKSLGRKRARPEPDLPTMTAERYAAWLERCAEEQRKIIREIIDGLWTVNPNPHPPG